MGSLPACETLLLEQQGSRLYITLNRPDVKNALNDVMVTDLGKVCDAIVGDRSIRTLVLRGSEGTFCAGGDIRGFKTSFESASPAAGQKDSIAINNRKFGDFLIKFNNLPQTTIGLIEGAAFGGGLGLTCVFDVTICMADTKFALSETGLGIPPAQIAPFVVQRIGLTNARRIGLTGARFDGRAAYELGLVSFLADTTEQLESILKTVLNDIGRCAPGANAATKKIMMDATFRKLSDTLDDAADAFASQLRGSEGQEGVKAFLEKRKANWVEKVG